MAQTNEQQIGWDLNCAPPPNATYGGKRLEAVNALKDTKVGKWSRKEFPDKDSAYRFQAAVGHAARELKVEFKTTTRKTDDGKVLLYVLRKSNAG